MKSKITIDYTKCNGCAKCVNACTNTVIQKVNNKIYVINEKKCDKEGNCIKVCEMNALHFENKQKEICIGEDCFINESELYNWPVKLMNIHCDNRYLEDSDLLIAADCTAFSYGAFHRDFIRDHVVLIACPKNNIYDKCLELFKSVRFNSVKVISMSSQCCRNLIDIVKKSIYDSGNDYDVYERVINSDGEVFE